MNYKRKKTEWGEAGAAARTLLITTHWSERTLRADSKREAWAIKARALRARGGIRVSHGEPHATRRWVSVDRETLSHRKDPIAIS